MRESYYIACCVGGACGWGLFVVDAYLAFLLSVNLTPLLLCFIIVIIIVIIMLITIIRQLLLLLLLLFPLGGHEGVRGVFLISSPSSFGGRICFHRYSLSCTEGNTIAWLCVRHMIVT